MSKDGPRDDARRLLAEIEADFEALVGLLDRAVKELSLVDGGNSDVDRLVRAKEAAQRGADMVREQP
jgi:hypothetical protein